MNVTVIDTSALLSILLGEPDAERFEAALFASRGDLCISASTLLETFIVGEARRPDSGARDLRTLLQVLEPEIVPVTSRTVELAFEGWRRYGRGHHKAALNVGDCFSYALAKERGAALLYKGEDFTQTDIASVF